MTETGKSQCQYCGNNPVPHFTHWYFETANILLTPIRRWLLYNPAAGWVKKQASRADWAGLLLRLLVFSGLARYQDDMAKCQIRRAQVLWESASRYGIAMRQVIFLGKALDCYLAKKPGGKTAKVFFGLPRPKQAVSDSLDWMDDKYLFKRFFLKHNLPVARGNSAAWLPTAVSIFQGLEKPVIVKPRAGSRGRHSTTYVSGQADFANAFRAAKQLCHWVMVEEQLFGPVYRATLIDYELCGVLRGEPPQVTGDGKSAILELVSRKNSFPHPGVKDIILDDSALRFLSRQNWGKDSVPPPGKTVALSEKIGVGYGGSSKEEFEVCHPDNRELFVRAARLLGDPIVGFDFIIPDITQSWRNQRCGFIEANSLPFINLHHDPLSGPVRNVAAKVWEMIQHEL